MRHVVINFLINFSLKTATSPFSLTTKHCFIGPISENISSRRSFEAEAGREPTKMVCAGMAVCLALAR